MTCPRCGAERAADAPDCQNCGIVFAKWVAPQFSRTRRVERALPVADELPSNGRIGRSELLILGFGFLAAVIVTAVPFLRFVGGALITLFHELGHAVAGWLMGYPSVPAFDFTYGGGVTPHGEFRLSIVLGIAAVFAWAAYSYRRNWRTLMAIAAMFSIWLFLVTAAWRREFVFTAAGHITELVLAAVFFYMALAGVGFRIPEIERPLGAAMAFFVTLNSILFARRLRSDPDFVAWYRQGKRGLLGDLESLALDVRLHFRVVDFDIGNVAGWLLLFSIVPFAVALFWYFNRRRCHQFLQRFLQHDIEVG